KAQTAIIAYCLMPNHVHLILQPSNEIGLRKIGEVHRLYTRYINRKMEWSGYLWQGRFGSYPMDDAYLYNALRYIELNPVFAGLCVSPEQYRWSSARQRIYFNSAHDLKTAPAPFTEDWKTYWKEGLEKHHIMQEIERNTIEQTPKLAGGTQ
ncbi:MAG: transposase, partial [Bdellovibrionales bacterium]